MSTTSKYSVYKKYFTELFGRALTASSFDCLLTLIRLEGVALGRFDPTEEVMEAVSDFSSMVQKAKSAKNPKTTLRMELLIYCHFTELSMPYDMLCNLLRCINGKNYRMMPFYDLKKKNIYPLDKIQVIKDECTKAKDTELPAFFDEFFDNSIRNAFYHSDYCITDEDFRIIEKRKYYKLADFTAKIDNGIAFYQAFFDAFRDFKFSFRKSRKFHVSQQHYEVLELLTNESHGLFGFNNHFSNGNLSQYYRLPDEVWGQNLHAKLEGMEYQCGNLGKMCKTYKIDNEEVKDFAALDMRRCEEYDDEVSFKSKHVRKPVPRWKILARRFLNHPHWLQ